MKNRTLGDIMSDNDRLIKAWNKAVDSIIKSLKKTNKPIKIKRVFDCDCTDEFGNPTVINIEKNGKKGHIIL